MDKGQVITSHVVSYFVIMKILLVVLYGCLLQCTV